MPDNQTNITKRKFQIEEWILILLILLSLTGIVIADFSPEDGYTYWIIMVFFFAISAMIIAWLQANPKPGEFRYIVKDQSLHWLTTLLVVAGAFSLESSGQLPEESASLVVLLLLSLATMLDGLRIGWRFSLVGLFLGASSLIGAFFDYFIWIDGVTAILIVTGTLMCESWLDRINNHAV